MKKTVTLTIILLLCMESVVFAMSAEEAATESAKVATWFFVKEKDQDSLFAFWPTCTGQFINRV